MLCRSRGRSDHRFPQRFWRTRLNRQCIEPNPYTNAIKHAGTEFKMAPAMQRADNCLANAAEMTPAIAKSMPKSAGAPYAKFQRGYMKRTFFETYQNKAVLTRNAEHVSTPQISLFNRVNVTRRSCDPLELDTAVTRRLIDARCQGRVERIARRAMLEAHMTPCCRLL